MVFREDYMERGAKIKYKKDHRIYATSMPYIVIDIFHILSRDIIWNNTSYIV